MKNRGGGDEICGGALKNTAAAGQSSWWRHRLVPFFHFLHLLARFLLLISEIQLFFEKSNKKYRYKNEVSKFFGSKHNKQSQRQGIKGGFEFVRRFSTFLEEKGRRTMEVLSFPARLVPVTMVQVR
ncbi:hypothetical protein RYX36_031284 [Vicia faba]